MNIFNNRKNNVDLAEQLFNTQILGGVIDSKYSYRINKILKKCTPYNEQYPERQQVLLEVIQLIGEPKTPRERYLVSMSYAWSRVQYRNYAIKYLNLYLDNELYADIYTYKNYKCIGKSTLEKNKKQHLLDMYNYLGKAYIGIYDFESALNIYEKAIRILPQNPIGYFGKVEVLTKQNKLLECKEWLLNIKEGSLYYKDNWFCKSIDKMLKETNEKIKNGYIYKQRIKK